MVTVLVGTQIDKMVSETCVLQARKYIWHLTLTPLSSSNYGLRHNIRIFVLFLLLVCLSGFFVI